MDRMLRATRRKPAKFAEYHAALPRAAPVSTTDSQQILPNLASAAMPKNASARKRKYASGQVKSASGGKAQRLIESGAAVTLNCRTSKPTPAQDAASGEILMISTDSAMKASVAAGDTMKRSELSAAKNVEQIEKLTPSTSISEKDSSNPGMRVDTSTGSMNPSSALLPMSDVAVEDDQSKTASKMDTFLSRMRKLSTIVVKSDSTKSDGMRSPLTGPVQSSEAELGQMESPTGYWSPPPGVTTDNSLAFHSPYYTVGGADDGGFDVLGAAGADIQLDGYDQNSANLLENQPMEVYSATGEYLGVLVNASAESIQYYQVEATPGSEFTRVDASGCDPDNDRGIHSSLQLLSPNSDRILGDEKAILDENIPGEDLGENAAEQTCGNETAFEMKIGDEKTSDASLRLPRLADTTTSDSKIEKNSLDDVSSTYFRTREAETTPAKFIIEHSNARTPRRSLAETESPCDVSSADARPCPSRRLPARSCAVKVPRDKQIPFRQRVTTCRKADSASSSKLNDSVGSGCGAVTSEPAASSVEVPLSSSAAKENDLERRTNSISPEFPDGNLGKHKVESDGCPSGISTINRTLSPRESARIFQWADVASKLSFADLKKVGQEVVSIQKLNSGDITELQARVRLNTDPAALPLPQERDKDEFKRSEMANINETEAKNSADLVSDGLILECQAEGNHATSNATQKVASVERRGLKRSSSLSMPSHSAFKAKRKSESIDSTDVCLVERKLEEYGDGSVDVKLTKVGRPVSHRCLSSKSVKESVRRDGVSKLRTVDRKDDDNPLFLPVCRASAENNGDDIKRVKLVDIKQTSENNNAFVVTNETIISTDVVTPDETNVPSTHSNSQPKLDDNTTTSSLPKTKKKEQSSQEKKKSIVRKKTEHSVQKNEEQKVQEKKEQSVQKKKEQSVQENKELSIQKKKEQRLQAKKKQNVQEEKELSLQKKREQSLQLNKELSVQEKNEQSVQAKIEQSIQEKKEQSMQEEKEQRVEEKKEQSVQEKNEPSLQEKKEQSVQEKKEQSIQEKKEQSIQEKIREVRRQERLRLQKEKESAFLFVPLKPTQSGVAQEDVANPNLTAAHCDRGPALVRKSSSQEICSSKIKQLASSQAEQKTLSVQAKPSVFKRTLGDKSRQEVAKPSAFVTAAISLSHDKMLSSSSELSQEKPKLAVSKNDPSLSINTDKKRRCASKESSRSKIKSEKASVSAARSIAASSFNDENHDRIEVKKSAGNGPTADKAAENSFTSNKTAENSLAAKKPAENSSTAKKLAEYSSRTKKTAENSSTTNKPAENSSTANKPAENSSTANKPAENSSTANKPAENSSTANKPAENSSTANKPAENSSTANKPAENSSTANKPAENSSTANKPAENSSTANKPAENSSTANKPAENSSTVNKPAENSSEAKKPAENISTANKPAKNSSRANKPAENSSTANKPAENYSTAYMPAENSSEAKKPAEKSSGAKKPAENSSCTVNKPAENSSCTVNKPAENSSCTVNKPAENSSCTVNKPAENSSCTVNKPAENSSFTVNKPAENSCTVNKPAENSSGARKPAENISTVKKPTGNRVNRLADNSSGASKPENSCMVNKPAENSFAANKPAENSSTTKKPTDNNSATEKLTENSSTTNHRTENRITECRQHTHQTASNKTDHRKAEAQQLQITAHYQGHSSCKSKGNISKNYSIPKRKSSSSDPSSTVQIANTTENVLREKLAEVAVVPSEEISETKGKSGLDSKVDEGSDDALSRGITGGLTSSSGITADVTPSSGITAGDAAASGIIALDAPSSGITANGSSALSLSDSDNDLKGLKGFTGDDMKHKEQPDGDDTGHASLCKPTAFTNTQLSKLKNIVLKAGRSDSSKSKSELSLSSCSLSLAPEEREKGFDTSTSDASLNFSVSMTDDFIEGGCCSPTLDSGLMRKSANGKTPMATRCSTDVDDASHVLWLQANSEAGRCAEASNSFLSTASPTSKSNNALGKSGLLPAVRSARASIKEFNSISEKFRGVQHLKSTEFAEKLVDRLHLSENREGVFNDECHPMSDLDVEWRQAQKDHMCDVIRDDVDFPSVSCEKTSSHHVESAFSDPLLVSIDQSESKSLDVKKSPGCSCALESKRELLLASPAKELETKSTNSVVHLRDLGSTNSNTVSLPCREDIIRRCEIDDVPTIDGSFQQLEKSIPVERSESGESLPQRRIFSQKASGPALSPSVCKRNTEDKNRNFTQLKHADRSPIADCFVRIEKIDVPFLSQLKSPNLGKSSDVSAATCDEMRSFAAVDDGKDANLNCFSATASSAHRQAPCSPELLKDLNENCTNKSNNDKLDLVIPSRSASVLQLPMPSVLLQSDFTPIERFGRKETKSLECVPLPSKDSAVPVFSANRSSSEAAFEKSRDSLSSTDAEAMPTVNLSEPAMNSPSSKMSSPSSKMSSPSSKMSSPSSKMTASLQKTYPLCETVTAPSTAPRPSKKQSAVSPRVAEPPVCEVFDESPASPVDESISLAASVGLRRKSCSSERRRSAFHDVSPPSPSINKKEPTSGGHHSVIGSAIPAVVISEAPPCPTAPTNTGSPIPVDVIDGSATSSPGEHGSLSPAVVIHESPASSVSPNPTESSLPAVVTSTSSASPITSSARSSITVGIISEAPVSPTAPTETVPFKAEPSVAETRLLPCSSMPFREAETSSDSAAECVSLTIIVDESKVASTALPSTKASGCRGRFVRGAVVEPQSPPRAREVSVGVCTIVGPPGRTLLNESLNSSSPPSGEEAADDSPASPLPPPTSPPPECLFPEGPSDDEGPNGRHRRSSTPVIIPLVIEDPELLRVASLARRAAMRRSSATSSDQ